MNEVLSTIRNRRSCRSYLPTMIQDEELKAVLDAGAYAPSGRGAQPVIVLAVTNREIRDQLSKANGAVGGVEGVDMFYGAPVVLVVLSDKSRKNTYVYDGAVAIESMMLAAESLGIGACWVHRAKEVFETELGKNLLKSLGIEGEYEGIGNLVLGYKGPAAPKPQPPRKENFAYFVK